MVPEKASAKQLRSFGLLVGGVFAILGAWPALFRAANPRLWALLTAAALVVPAVVFPSVLQPLYRGWMFIGAMLGWINTRIILGFIFCVVFTPVGLLMRLFGRDTLNLKSKPTMDSYRVTREPRPGSHMKHQF
ncbi:MAG: SxtJ family membrane protein [Acidobacteria bacterium]|nr:SxtJ family membrane protein [Acidobacteriota bacterium]MCI0718272.1 SxtJ family membrane protein [Acidobacteriota bacterium]